MGKNEQKQKDATMAARLKDDAYHNAKAVAARKQARFNAFMKSLRK